MTLTPFEIIFSLLIFVFAVFPVRFLYYLKSHPEKIKEYAVRPTHKKSFANFSFGFWVSLFFRYILSLFLSGPVWLPLILLWLTVSDFQPG